jgi:hypothetical protein
MIGFDRAHQALAMVAARVGIARIGRAGVLRRDHEPVALALRERAGVDVRGVDEVPAGGDEHPPGVALVGAPSPLRSDCHRPQRERRDPEARAAEQFVAIE